MGAGAYGTAISKWFNQDIKAYKVEGEMCFDCKVVGKDLGVFLSDVI
jgi:glycerol-3-phosphate dehydrogenase